MKMIQTRDIMKTSIRVVVDVDWHDLEVAMREPSASLLRQLQARAENGCSDTLFFLAELALTLERQAQVRAAS